MTALDRDALKARAVTLGIEYAKNVSTEKLAELVEAASVDNDPIPSHDEAQKPNEPTEAPTEDSVVCLDEVPQSLATGFSIGPRYIRVAFEDSDAGRAAASRAASSRVVEAGPVRSEMIACASADLKNGAPVVVFATRDKLV